MTGTGMLVLLAWLWFMLFGCIGLLMWVYVGPITKDDSWN